MLRIKKKPDSEGYWLFMKSLKVHETGLVRLIEPWERETGTYPPSAVYIIEEAGEWLSYLTDEQLIDRGFVLWFKIEDIFKEATDGSTKCAGA